MSKAPSQNRFLRFGRNDKLRLSSRLEGACDRNGEIFLGSAAEHEISPLASLGRNDSRLHSLRSVEMTTDPIRSASAGVIVVCVIPSVAEESPERRHRARIDFSATVEKASSACHLDWREPATGMERSFLAVPPSMRFLHSLRLVEMTVDSTRFARSK